MPTLSKLHSREVLDSRGQPTVEVEVWTDSGARGRSIVPSGLSTGRHEAVELRDCEHRRYGGRGVRRAVENVRSEIASALRGWDLEDQAGIDAKLIELDGTPDRSRLGANALVGVSMAVAEATAEARGEELYEHLHRLWIDRFTPSDRERIDPGPGLPVPMVNMISGGRHAGGQLDFQDFLIVPTGVQCYSDALEVSASVYRSLGAILKDFIEESALVSDGGGYRPRLRTNQSAVDRILEAVLACGLKMGEDVCVALDVAASAFFDPERQTYRLTAIGDDELDSAEMVLLLEHWAKQYPIVSIEDGLAADDWDGWVELTARLGVTMQLVGDDLFTTQASRIQRGIDRKAANAVLIKPNQAGTLSETLDAILLARRHGFRTILSARSGETEDTSIADLAVAVGASQIKIGSVARSERLAKYNRLLRIEEHLGGPEVARFYAWKAPECE
ncbi:phosphopyruvate hydratase [soil metagenome]